MRKLVLISALSCALLGAGAAQATTYNAYDQFNIAGGAITATDFAYGWTPNAPFTGSINDYNTFQTACGGDPNVQCASLNNFLPGVFKAAGAYDSPGTPFFEANELNLHPGPGGETVAIQFIVPVAGLYTFTGGWHAHDVFPNGVDVSGYIGAAQQFTSVMVGGPYNFNFNANLAAGDRVSFVMGAAGNYTFDSTGFALTVDGQAATPAVPEPATWALMILGFGGVGALMRRRRLGALAA